MIQENKGAFSDGRIPPAVIVEEFRQAAQNKTEGPMLSAYALALRDPGLFSALYTTAPKRIH